ncbi:acyltransferase family protein [Rhodococcus xishaensis]|nr:acyltransferase [Rhodococcus xishaensis]
MDTNHLRQTAPVGDPRAFVPALDGMRGFAALGVLVTHVAFQTGAVGDPVVGRIWGRFDLAVAVFFALSGFLLWRPHAGAARGLGAPPRTVKYWISRAARILPAYWVAVVLVLAFLPAAGGGWQVWTANLALIQVFVPLTLTEGLTQMWSLSVEVAFYLVLPIIALTLVRLRGAAARFRVPVLLTVALVSLVWAFLPVPSPAGIHHDNWLPGYIPWFAAGMLLAELAMVGGTWVHRLAERRVLMAAIALVAFGLSTTWLAGPEGLVRPEPWQYATKIALGAVMGFALLAPLALAHHRHRILASPLSLAVGRWSYGVFIWHLPVLTIVFPMFGITPFSGNFWFVLAVTTVLSIAVASASYALVEDPARRAVHRWERRRHIGERDSGSAVTPTQTTPISANS